MIQIFSMITRVEMHRGSQLGSYLSTYVRAGLSIAERACLGQQLSGCRTATEAGRDLWELKLNAAARRLFNLARPRRAGRSRVCVRARSLRGACRDQSWALSVFFNFFNNKMNFCIFHQVNLTGSGLFK